MKLKRTNTCGDLNASFDGKNVVLSGWVDGKRDHGGLLFIDLKDRYGITQTVFDPQSRPDLYENAREVKPQSVISVRGAVRKRRSLTPSRPCAAAR